jgi:hydroxymethylpyrimidine pyrophosphatase-like HAD family hydrolase
MYSTIERVARENGFDFICDGNNISDLVIDRPGILVTYEKGFRTPFIEAKLSSAEIHEYLNENNILKFDMVAEMKAILEKETQTFVKDNRMSFLVVMYPCHETAIMQTDFVKRLMKDYPVLVERQGRKVYVLPHGLGKEVAVKYLIDVMGITPTFTSGDGFVDEKFVSLGENPLVPGHAYFEYSKKMKTSGIMAGERILDEVERSVLNE